MTLEQLESEASRLSEEERAKLISRIAAKLGSGLSEQLEKEWALEIRRRIESLDMGSVTPRNVDDVITELLSQP